MPFAAIAQPVERILGKDEVASSNLASSSRKTLEPQRLSGFSFLQRKPLQLPNGDDLVTGADFSCLWRVS